jgi:crotonobetainyl-CoA:carnitine CoA-transferase CaiB-like acyl-CoA transferase
VVDAAIVDGAANLATTFFGMLAAGIWKSGPGRRGTNITDSGSHFYDSYECKDGGYISVGPIEDKFYAEWLKRMDIDPETIGKQMDAGNWKAAKAIVAARFKTRTRDEWAAILEESDACASPVLSFHEAPEHPHMKARGVFVEVDGVVQPAPAPKFSRTRPDLPIPPQAANPANTDKALAPWLGGEEIARLRAAGVID